MASACRHRAYSCLLMIALPKASHPEQVEPALGILRNIERDARLPRDRLRAPRAIRWPTLAAQAAWLGPGSSVLARRCISRV